MADSSFVNWPFFDASHGRLVHDLRAWAAREIAPLDEPHTDAAALDAHCRKLVAKLGAAGWLRYCVPGDFGGAGPLAVRAICLCRETLSYVSGLADFTFAMQGLGTGPISLFGSDQQKQRYLPNVVAGKTIAAFALSEPNAGSDVGAMTTSATRDGERYVLNGTKTWISNAGLADHYVIFARSLEGTGTKGPGTKGTGTKGLSAFIVDADNPGLRVTERIVVSAPHPLGTIRLEDCRVDADAVIGEPGKGFGVAMGTLDVFRSTVGAAALGFARRAMDEAVDRARARQAFGRQLHEFQLIQAKIADMAVSVDAAALLIYRAAWTKDSAADARVTREASMAKLFATEEAQKVVDQAVQIFGGLGVVHGSRVENLYREVRALRIYEGTSEIQKLVIAGEVLKQG
jgi:acyl-CoA dehydrogenase